MPPLLRGGGVIQFNKESRMLIQSEDQNRGCATINNEQHKEG